jgi:hypothetical protein
MDDSDKAMKAVIDDMGRHARAAKARRYQPKPVQHAAPEPHDMSTGELSEQDFAHLLNTQHDSRDEEAKELQVQR